MTNEQAIEILRDTPIDIRSTREDDIHTLYATAQNMAIEALSNSQNQSDSEVKTKADSVSEADVIYRQDAIDAAIKADIENHNGILSEKRARVFENHIAILPSAQRTGEWIETEFLKLRECSCCHVRWGMYDVENFNFCPNCGADMRGAQE